MTKIARGAGRQSVRGEAHGLHAVGLRGRMGGALFAIFIGQIYPQFVFDPLFDISIALMRSSVVSGR